MDSMAIAGDLCKAHSVDDVVDWLEKQGKRGDIGADGARLRITATKQMAACIGEDEPADAFALLANIDELERRWATKNRGAKADTVRTYASRAKTSVEAYQRWLANPSARAAEIWGTTPAKSGAPKAAKKEASRKPPATAAIVPVASVPVAATPTLPPSSPAGAERSEYARKVAPGDLRACPLGSGREPFHYLLPSDGLKVRDAVRIAFHLITACDDYDPMMSPLQVFVGMQRAQEHAVSIAAE